MPQAVIDKVNSLAADQPCLITFTDRQGNEIGSDDDDVITPPQVSSQTSYEIPGVIADTAQITGVDMDAAEDKHQQNDQTDDLANDPGQTDPSLLESGTDFEPTLDEVPTPSKNVGTQETNEPTRQVTVSSPPTTNEPTRRPTRDRKQTKSYVPSMSGKSYQYSSRHEPQIVEMVLTQLTLKAAINKWGLKATCAAEAEMKQLHWRNTFKPVKYSKLMDRQKETIFESHIFLTEQRTGKIMGRTVAGGNRQRGYIEKEDASSPTVATELVILTAVVDASENHQTAVIDIPNAFIQTVVKDRKRRVIIRIRGMLVDMLVKIAPEVYQSYVTTDRKGVPQRTIRNNSSESVILQKVHQESKGSRI